MGTRDEVNLNPQVTNVGDAAAINAEALSEDLGAHDVLHHSVEGIADLLGGISFFEIIEVPKEIGLNLLHVLVRRVVAVLLARDSQQLLQFLGSCLLDGLVHVVTVSREERELLCLLSSTLRQASLRLTQGLDERLSSLKALSHGGLLRGRSTFLDALSHVHAGAGLHHHDGDVILAALLHDAAGHNHVEQCALMLFIVREGYPLAFWVLVVGDECHAHAADRARNRQAGELRRGRRAVDGDNVVVLLRVHGQHRDNDLDLVAQALDKSRAQRTVDKAAGQDSFGGGASLTAEEGARDLARSVHALLHVHGQREEVKAFARLVGRRGGGQEHGVFVQVGGHGATSLASKLTGFKTDGAGAEVAIVQSGDGLGDAIFIVDGELDGVGGGVLYVLGVSSAHLCDSPWRCPGDLRCRLFDSVFLTTPKNFTRWHEKTPAQTVRGLVGCVLSDADPDEKSGHGNDQRR